MSDYMILRCIVLVPLLGALVNGVVLLARREKQLSRNVVALIACSASGVAFVLSFYCFQQLGSLPLAKRALVDQVYPWLSSGQLHVDLGLRMDPLSGLMCLLITGVGSLIHIYSFGYLFSDDDYPRFFAYLNLLLSAMLLLVLGDGLLVAFLGWQGVSLASYLLIGFWFHRHHDGVENAGAGVKAFVLNRIGDLGFVLGMITLFWALSPELAGKSDPFNFAIMESKLDYLRGAYIFGFSALEVSGLCIFVGVMAKSAQLPLHIWFPQATAGPTPVSAMLHAVTVAAAGVYMIARLGFLYSVSPHTSMLIAGLGALTAVVAACIGLFQYDIKKVLAYAAVSQLGLIFIAMGVGAYSIGIFHLMTHAFFAALLFLGAGAVIVGMNGERDIRKMGGLFKYMKVTGATFFLGTMAIMGFPLFSGFFSKDEVLWASIATHHPLLWAMGWLATILTAFFMTRLFCLTFMGELRVSKEELHHRLGGHPHEPPLSMTVPLMVLGALSVFGGFVGVPEVIAKFMDVKGHSVLQHWLQPVFQNGWSHHPYGALFMHTAQPHLPLMSEWRAMGFAFGGMMVGSGLALMIYATNARKSLEREARYLSGQGGWLGAFHRLTYHKFYIEEFLHSTIARPIQDLARGGLWPFDQVVVDGFVNLCARLTQRFSRLLSWIQGGNVKIYLYGMAVGLVSLLLWLMLNQSSF